jgi:hypothetical protein
MQDWVDRNFVWVFPLYFAAMWLMVMYTIALMGGWRRLAKRFRLQGTYDGQKWMMQSARMRWSARYNSALTIGANQSGLFIVPFILFRTWHPPLFVPWAEIAATRKKILFFDLVELRLGRSENIPFIIRPNLAAKIEAAAGSSWPAGYPRSLVSPPPPIG